MQTVQPIFHNFADMATSHAPYSPPDSYPLYETYSYRGPTINSRQHYMTSGATATAMTPHLFQRVRIDNPYKEAPDISTVNRGTGRLRGPAMPYIPPSGPWQDRLTRPRRHPSRSSGRYLYHARPTPLPDHAPRGRQYAAGA